MRWHSRRGLSETISEATHQRFAQQLLTSARADARRRAWRSHSARPRRGAWRSGDELIGAFAVAAKVRTRWLPCDARGAERQHLCEVTRGLVRPGAVGLVHDEDVRDLEHAGLDRLDVVTKPRHGDQAHRVGDAHDLHFLLPYSDGLDEHDAIAERVEDIDDARRRAREAAGMAATRHAPDEEALIEEPLAHADAVAEDRAAAERRGRVDGDDRDAVGRRAVRAGETIHQRALAASGRSGDADDLGMPRQRI